ncbi:MAG: FeoA family protein [Christensenellales bacterium]|jgi:ferrous iron transport protein A
MPLTLAKPGESIRIQRITGRHDIRRRLASMGFVEGETVTIIAQRAGDMILALRDTRIALDRALASRIMVSHYSAGGPPHRHRRGWE